MFLIFLNMSKLIKCLCYEVRNGAQKRLLGREMGLKAEQTSATLTPLIALRTWSLEGLPCIHVCVWLSGMSMCAWTLASHGLFSRCTSVGESRTGQGQRHWWSRTPTLFLPAPLSSTDAYTGSEFLSCQVCFSHLCFRFFSLQKFNKGPKHQLYPK